ncbi:MAG: hypothetical protein PHC70_04080 [Patescibacteria group bacterium]|nr:hypothetical protein [Patescibacteria group bacterium]
MADYEAKVQTITLELGVTTDFKLEGDVVTEAKKKFIDLQVSDHLEVNDWDEDAGTGNLTASELKDGELTFKVADDDGESVPVVCSVVVTPARVRTPPPPLPQPPMPEPQPAAQAAPQAAQAQPQPQPAVQAAQPTPVPVVVQPVVAVQAAPATKQCPSCNASNDVNAVHCTNCGASFTGGAPAPNSPAANAQAAAQAQAQTPVQANATGGTPMTQQVPVVQQPQPAAQQPAAVQPQPTQPQQPVQAAQQAAPVQQPQPAPAQAPATQPQQPAQAAPANAAQPQAAGQAAAPAQPPANAAQQPATPAAPGARSRVRNVLYILGVIGVFALIIVASLILRWLITKNQIAAPASHSPVTASASAVAPATSAPVPVPGVNASLCPVGYTAIPVDGNSCNYMGWDGDSAPYAVDTVPTPGRLVVCRTKPDRNVATGATLPLTGYECTLCWPSDIPTGAAVPASQVAWRLLGQRANHVTQPAWYADCRTGYNRRCGMLLKDPSCVRKNADGSDDLSNCLLEIPAPIQ